MRVEAGKGEGTGEEELKPRENNSHCKLNRVTLSGNSILSTIKIRVIYSEVPSRFTLCYSPIRPQRSQAHSRTSTARAGAKEQRRWCPSLSTSLGRINPTCLQGNKAGPGGPRGSQRTKAPAPSVGGSWTRLSPGRDGP